MSTYRRKTGWKPQEERQFVLSDDRASHIDLAGVADLLLTMSLRGRSSMSEPLKTRIAVAPRLEPA